MARGGRTHADVLLPDGTNVNYTLVKERMCWWYRKYASLNTELEALEKAARDTKKGLWVDPAPVPSWVYRKAKRGQAMDLSDLAPLDAEGGRQYRSARGSPRRNVFGEPQAKYYAPPITQLVLRGRGTPTWSQNLGQVGSRTIRGCMAHVLAPCESNDTSESRVL